MVDKILVNDRDTHIAGGTSHDFHGCVDVIGIEIGQFDLRDFLQLDGGDLTDFFLVGFVGTSFNFSGFFDQYGSRRCLEYEGETPIFKDRNFDWDDRSGLFGGLGIVFFTECHDIHTMLTQCWADWRCGVSFTSVEC